MGNFKARTVEKYCETSSVAHYYRHVPASRVEKRVSAYTVHTCGRTKRVNAIVSRTFSGPRNSGALLRHGISSNAPAACPPPHFYGERGRSPRIVFVEPFRIACQSHGERCLSHGRISVRGRIRRSAKIDRSRFAHTRDTRIPIYFYSRENRFS